MHKILARISLYSASRFTHLKNTLEGIKCQWIDRISCPQFCFFYNTSVCLTCFDRNIKPNQPAEKLLATNFWVLIKCQSPGQLKMATAISDTPTGVSRKRKTFCVTRFAVWLLNAHTPYVQDPFTDKATTFSSSHGFSVNDANASPWQCGGTDKKPHYRIRTRLLWSTLLTYIRGHWRTRHIIMAAILIQEDRNNSILILNTWPQYPKSCQFVCLRVYQMPRVVLLLFWSLTSTPQRTDCFLHRSSYKMDKRAIFIVLLIATVELWDAASLQSLLKVWRKSCTQSLRAPWSDDNRRAHSLPCYIK